jgi:hypothetical protein
MILKSGNLIDENKLMENEIKKQKPAPNRIVNASPPSGARLPQNRSRATPFVRFFSSTFGAGVNASHCPITCPKRRKQPER